MGGWSFMEPRLLSMLGATRTLRLHRRPASARQATGSHTIHEMDLQALIKAGFEDLA